MRINLPATALVLLLQFDQNIVVHNIWFKPNCADALEVPETIQGNNSRLAKVYNLSPIGPKNLSKIGRTDALGKRWGS